MAPRERGAFAGRAGPTQAQDGRAPDAEMRRRICELAAQAAALLGEPALAAQPEPAPGQIAALLLERLRDQGDNSCASEHERHLAELAEIGTHFEHRRDCLADVQDAIGALAQITSPTAMLEHAPRLLCAASELDVVLLSTIERGRLVARTACFRDRPDQGQAALRALARTQIALEHPLLDAEALRRRRATLVANARLQARAHAEMTRIMGWHSYVVAPVTLGAQRTAVLHAARNPGRVEARHRDVLWKFAVGLATAHESAALRRRLRRERWQMRQFLDRLDIRLAGVSEEAVRLGPGRSRTRSPEVRPGRGQAAGESVLADILTRREIEILGLLADGLTNRAIADRLVVSDGTVKFHVHRILRKLRVSNRAEAVSRYLMLGRMRVRTSEG
ncbi:MAG: response regulator transcription factor [Solirubrobacteraceae bacterium]